jgi:hypothetical protein
MSPYPANVAIHGGRTQRPSAKASEAGQALEDEGTAEAWSGPAAAAAAPGGGASGGSTARKRARGEGWAAQREGGGAGAPAAKRAARGGASAAVPGAAQVEEPVETLQSGAGLRFGVVKEEVESGRGGAGGGASAAVPAAQVEAAKAREPLAELTRHNSALLVLKWPHPRRVHPGFPIGITEAPAHPLMEDLPGEVDPGRVNLRSYAAAEDMLWEAGRAPAV